MALTHLEQELVWLTQKVNRDKALIAGLEKFFDKKQANWSREVLDEFLRRLEQMRDQLYFEEHRLEMLAWKIHEYREGNQRNIEINPN